MDNQTILSSGDLELYVLGLLPPDQESNISRLQDTDMAIKAEIFEISKSLGQYAQARAIKAPAHIFENIFGKLPHKAPQGGTSQKIPNQSTGFGLGAVLAAVFAVTGLYLGSQFFEQKGKLEEINKLQQAQQVKCDSIQTQLDKQYALMQDINDSNNQIIPLQSTPGYAGITVYLHYNPVNKKNYLQMIRVPNLNPDQAYQLWSLKDGQNPIPMDVFTGVNEFVAVDFEDGTATYAITIEPKGGSTVPTLANLIGTMTV